MAAEDEVREIDEPVEHQNPGEEEMPAPPHRQILVRRQRRPGRKAALFKSAVIPTRGAEHASRVEGVPEDRR